MAEINLSSVRNNTPYSMFHVLQLYLPTPLDTFLCTVPRGSQT